MPELVQGVCGGIGAVYAHHDVTFEPVSGLPAIDSGHYDCMFGYQLMTGMAQEIAPAVAMA